MFEPPPITDKVALAEVRPSLAVRVCVPDVIVESNVNTALKVPADEDVAVAIKLPSKLIVIPLLGVNPEPVTVTDAPAVALVGEMVIEAAAA